MSDIRIASRYAKSLIDLAVERGTVNEVHADVKLLHEVLAGSKELVNLLKSPIIRGDQKLKVLDKAFKASFTELSMLFLSTVVRKNRESYLPLIAKEFISIYNERNNIAKATVTTASAVDAATLESIKKQLEKESGKTIEIESSVDPAIIGGLVVRLGDTLYDASIAKKLRKIKQEIVLN